jgi:hypothetical protein
MSIQNALLLSLLNGLIGTFVGAALVWFLTWRKERQERKSVAMALLWEIDDFYKLSIRNVIRKMRDSKPDDLKLDVKSLTFVRFAVYQGTADKVGLFEPGLVQGIVGWYGTAGAYLDTIHDYGQTIERMLAGEHQLRKKAVALLTQIKEGAESFVPITQTVCNGLASLAGAKYTFEVP